MTFRFTCSSCGEVHEGIPTFGTGAPLIARMIPDAERETRVELGSDDCVVDKERFLIRGCLEIPVVGETDPFVWGVWVDVSQRDFDEWAKSFRLDKRSHLGPYGGYLGTTLPGYPDTFNLHAVVWLRDSGIRPLVEIPNQDHPLHREQCQGISIERVQELYGLVMHG
jgi:hypothetical protein